MRITLDTETDDVRTAIRTVYQAFGIDPDEDADGESADASTPAANGSAILPGGWTDKKLRKWAGFLTEDASEVVRYVAANAPEVPFDDVAQHLGQVKGMSGPVSGSVLGGAMSSGGHARKKVRGAPGTVPLDRDYGLRAYVMDERIAEILADELGEPEQP